jgi:hypothetical protein
MNMAIHVTSLLCIYEQVPLDIDCYRDWLWRNHGDGPKAVAHLNVPRTGGCTSLSMGPLCKKNIRDNSRKTLTCTTDLMYVFTFILFSLLITRILLSKEIVLTCSFLFSAWDKNMVTIYVDFTFVSSSTTSWLTQKSNDQTLVRIENYFICSLLYFNFHKY